MGEERRHRVGRDHSWGASPSDHASEFRARCYWVRSLFFIAALAVPTLAATHPWPLKDPFTVMDTISTLQDYGGTPGFHHGLDLQALAGTEVFAPVGGKVTLDYYYPRYKSPYTFRVSIEAADGLRWELHHVDPATVPASVHAAAAQGGAVAEGTFVARITDASSVGLPSHVHVEVINGAGVRQDPLRYLPPLADKIAPLILGVYIVDENSHAVAQQSGGTARGVVPLGRHYELVVDAVDMIPPGAWGDALYALDVSLNGSSLHSVRFDALPDADYLKGVTDVYRVKPFKDLDGNTLKNQIDLKARRHFLYRMPFVAPLAPGPLNFEVRALDYAHNETRVSITLCAR